MNLTVKTFISLTFCFSMCCAYSQFDNTLAELGLKNAVKSVLETDYQIGGNESKAERNVLTKFSENGCKTEERHFVPSGEISYSANFKYSSSGELMEETVNNTGKDFVRTYSSNAQKITIHIRYETAAQLSAEYYLDDKGKVTQRVDYDDEGKTFRTFKYSYSSNRLQLETQTMQESILQFKYAYNSKGRLEKKMEMSPAGKTLHTVSYTYDANGNVLTETSSYSNDPDKLVIQYKYIYDNRGNWTEKRESMNGNLFSITKREITYY
ncbi:MAG: hypothetical protein LBD59_02000 [Prevotellaceae bacterium]|jgi:hypothetical protein|nr:hypothetical protein [Prevotellaceae bacterium]